MAATVTVNQKELLSDLLRRGPWRNESEIIRHGIELVRAELEANELAPLSDAQTKASYAAMTEDELAEDAALSQSSLAAQKGTQ